MRTSIEVSEEEGVRYLHFGSRWIQGAMRIARPYALELEYTRDMMMPLLLRRGDAWPRTVLQVGLGAASLTRFLHRHRPRAAQTIVEIEPQVIAAAVQSFKLPPTDAQPLRTQSPTWSRSARTRTTPRPPARGRAHPLHLLSRKPRMGAAIRDHHPHRRVHGAHQFRVKTPALIASGEAGRATAGDASGEGGASVRRQRFQSRGRRVGAGPRR